MASAAVPESTAAECAALQALFLTTGGATSWTASAGYAQATSATTRCCDWYGVSCSADGHVVSLDLRSNNLTGGLPANLASLTMLETLKLNGNNLRGTLFPATQLPALQQLHIRQNAFSGELMGEIGSMKSLAYLFASDNQFTSINENVGNGPSLSVLFLGNNLLNAVPKSVATMPNLKVLFVAWSFRFIDLRPARLTCFCFATRHLNGNNFTHVPSELGAYTGDRCSLVAHNGTGGLRSSLCLPDDFPSNSPCLKMYYDDFKNAWVDTPVSIPFCSQVGDTDPTTSVDANAKSDSSSVSAGVAALLGVLVTTLFVAMAFVAYRVHRLRRRQRQSTTDSDETPPPHPVDRAIWAAMRRFGGARSGSDAAVLRRDMHSSISRDGSRPPPMQSTSARRSWFFGNLSSGKSKSGRRASTSNVPESQATAVPGQTPLPTTLPRSHGDLVWQRPHSVALPMAAGVPNAHAAASGAAPEATNEPGAGYRTLAQRRFQVAYRLPSPQISLETAPKTYILNPITPALTPTEDVHDEAASSLPPALLPLAAAAAAAAAESSLGTSPASPGAAPGTGATHASVALSSPTSPTFPRTRSLSPDMTATGPPGSPTTATGAVTSPTRQTFVFATPSSILGT
ncbi:hypothetical protein AMAG_02994 [Allomyces macrogynus ATCC 38327]|uniref:Leucine-rich repeat-containing N-terminal plant-type domain-containing protein n=1 Tax=Allomyces macrogynus (strain ATCC 38327) TaxID=578462 RepID=A0A0L0S4D6_ALLM3|nr:hypothetical protein AMAG_02994 [Allomyces macrogynus ATCC 38327]|eukprot:KNE57261.1 hypothetical protein AMAG_02994 [Allomyces macrogynus ATCC 38327]